MVQIGNDWDIILKEEFQKAYYLKLAAFVNASYQNKVVYPPKEKMFAALKMTAFSDVKVVVLGQDPYHGPFQANGLSFSVNRGVKLPPSLVNIYKELHDDIGVKPVLHGDLSSWAMQGVLLLNAMLTVEEKKPGSHQNQGWETFTDAIIEKLSKEKEGVIFLLWGSYAQKKGKKIDRTKHTVIESVHPSPLSVYRGFYGSKPFSAINACLRAQGKAEINWSIEA